MEKRASKPTKLHAFKAKLLSTYYGHPVKDLKLICIAGSVGKTDIANFVREILGTAEEPVAVAAPLGRDLKLNELHRFLSDAWKYSAKYVIITTSVESLTSNLFLGLPIHLLAITDFNPTTTTPSATSLTELSPEIVVLNRDDHHYDQIQNLAGTTATLTYGSDFHSNIQIEGSKLYKKGTEAHLNLSGTRLTVASFLAGESTVSEMTAAAAIAHALQIDPDHITAGIANYDPEADATDSGK